MWHESFAIFLAIRKNEFPQKKKKVLMQKPVGWGGVLDGNAGLAGLSVTSSFHTLSAVCSGKILVFIQYIISI